MICLGCSGTLILLPFLRVKGGRGKGLLKLYRILIMFWENVSLDFANLQLKLK